MYSMQSTEARYCYREALCVSAVFIVVRCPSVCPSVTLVDCIHTAEDIVKHIVRPSSLITLVFFRTQAQLPNSKGTPSAGAQSTRGGKILRIFD